tara:strand:- start:284 stop:736 length:453 start_codon:yes stop_codon:yes gene_type:complete
MSFFGDLIAGQAAEKASNYNASLMERDAVVKEQNAKQGYQVFTTYDLPRFNYDTERQQSALRNQLAGSGVEIGTGTAFDIVAENQYMIDTDRDMAVYNAEVVKERGFNDAIMTRASANVERFRGRTAKKASYFRAAGSLLTSGKNMGAFG